MSERVKQRLDLDWHDFLDALNSAYEDAYKTVMSLVGNPEAVEQMRIEEVRWPVNGEIYVCLGAYVAPGRDLRGERRNG